MPQRDYILRLIEQMGAAMVALRNKILGRKVDPEKIHQELTGLAGQTGLDLQLLRGFTADTLHMLVAPTGEVEPARCWLMAELIYLDGLQAEAEERWHDAVDALRKARLLYTLIGPGGGLLVGLPEAGDRIADVDTRLASFPTERP
ncbi:MAG TPA: hypothetical protein VLA36_06055 [Longimicrobiales bacterium]|nr:hypothetical protein [Longimicrobiales bacterium]